jgi:lysophospholipase L1-like esterase
MGRTSRRIRVASAGVLVLSLLPALWAGTQAVLDTCEDISSWEASGEVTLTKAEGRPGAGSALLLKFTTEKAKAAAFGRRPLRGDPTWEMPEGGVSLWLKGDGSAGFFAVELVDSSFRHRYAALLPVRETDWHRADLPWREFVPEIYEPEAEPLPLFDPKGGLKPSIVFSLFLGRWFYFLNHFDAYQVTVDDITLETNLPFDTTDYTPAAPGLPRTLAKLQGKEPVTIVCMGDSITFGVGAGGPSSAYPGKLEGLLRQRFASENIKVVNSGVGGLEVPQGSVLIPRDVVPHNPDLVTVLYGYNDLAPGGVTRDQFQTAVSVFVDRVRRLTKGQAEVLLITSLPGTSDEAWERLKAGAESIRELAEEKRCGLCDADAAFRALGREKLVAEYFREKDPAHPNPRGQDLLANLLLEAIAGK